MEKYFVKFYRSISDVEIESIVTIMIGDEWFDQPCWKDYAYKIYPSWEAAIA